MSSMNEAGEYRKPTNLASPGRRWLAQIIDSVISFVFAVLAYQLFALFAPLQESASLLGVALGAGYYLLSDALPKGQSIGKRLLKMAVVSDVSYIDCTLLQSVLRNITTPVLGIFDWVFIFFGSRKRLGDMLASTIVINV